MPYTRELTLDRETEDKLIAYIDDELNNHFAERSPHIHDLLRWQRDYWARPTVEEATFPFKGAATLIVPLNAIAVEAVHARNMTTRFALSQLVSAHAVSADWEEAAAPYEKFFNRELLDVMKIRKTLGDCYLEAEKYGTQIGKVGYERMVRTSVRMVGDQEQEVDVVVRDGAQFDAVPDARFLMPNGSRDPQTSPWCGEEHSETPYQVMQLEAGGAFKAGTIINQEGWQNDFTKEAKLYSWINRITSSGEGIGGNTVERAAEFQERTEAMWPKRIDWVEIWLAFDIDGSNRLKEIVVHYHRSSRTIMSCRYNPHTDLRRPYRTGPYFPVEHRWRGIGICKMNEQFQKEITVQHRQRIDNATLANMRMLKVSKDSGYGPKEPVFPGKMWFLNDMSHVETLQLGEIYPSSYSNEQATLIYAQQRTGVNELNQGMPQAGTPGTATSDLARIQEGNKKHDFIYENFTEFTEAIIIDIADITQQYGPRNVTYLDTAEHGDKVKKVLQMPSSYIRDGLIIQLRASTQQHNKLLDRQNWIQLAPIFQQYYEGLLQLAMQGGMKQLEQIILLKGMNSGTEALRQILETYDIRNIDRLVVKEIEEMVRNELQGAGASGGGSGEPSNPSQSTGMDQLAKAFSFAGQSRIGAPT